MGAFLEILKAHTGPMRAGEMRDALVGRGVDEASVMAAWKRARPWLAGHPQVTQEHGKYRWSDDTPAQAVAEGEISPAEAVARLVKGARLKAAERRRLGEIALSGLDGEPADERRHVEARIRGEFLRALAELAMDLEELIGAEASPAALVERIRTGTQAHGLTPIGEVGEITVFDARIHHPIAGSPDAETSVMVIRPGCVLRAGEDEVLLAKARVIDQ